MHKIFWLFFGFFIVFLGFLSIITGVAQMITADDVVFLVQIEEMLFVQETISKQVVIFSGLLRFILGILFVIIGNSFMIRGGIHERACHPRIGDFKDMKFR